MTRINDLFCTPEQGRRLKELVPDLTSEFVWRRLPNWSDWLIVVSDITDNKYHETAPALTLQELRDVVNDCVTNSKWIEFRNNLICANAPELAEWVIERLGEL